MKFFVENGVSDYYQSFLGIGVNQTKDLPNVSSQQLDKLVALPVLDSIDFPTPLNSSKWCPRATADLHHPQPFGRATAAVCGLRSAVCRRGRGSHPTRSRDGSKRPKPDHFGWVSHPNACLLRPGHRKKINMAIAKPVLDSDRFSSESDKVELAGDGRPAPAAHPADCCGLPSPTRSPDRSERPKTDHFRFHARVVRDGGRRRPAR